MGKKAERAMTGFQNCDVVATYANIGALFDIVGFRLYAPLEILVQVFVDWYKRYHGGLISYLEI